MRTNLTDAFTPAERAAWKPKIVERNTFRFQRPRRGDGKLETVIRLHDTDIVTLDPDGGAVYTSGGWRSVTTKARISSYGPFPVVALKGEWYVEDKDGLAAALMAECGQPPTHEDADADARWQTYWAATRKLAPQFRTPFRDGIRLPNAFKHNVLGEEALTAERALRKQIKAYADLYKKGFPAPNNGDCWFCMMRTAPGKGDPALSHANPHAAARHGLSLGDAAGDLDHLRAHIAEGYVMGSVAVNALAEAGAGDPVFAARVWPAARVAKYVRTYLCKRFGIAP